MSELEINEVGINNQNEEERARKTVEEIKSANDAYAQKLRLLNEKKSELQILQVETFEALQKASALNEQFNMIVNRKLLSERDKLQEEVSMLKAQLDKKLRI